MGKKLSQSSLNKISSSKSCQNKKHQQCLTSLVKVLKPRVYITTSSNFKSLVQQLTGNGNTLNGSNPSINITSPSPPLPLPIPVPIVEIDNHENNIDVSFDSSQVNTNFIPNTATFGFQDTISPNFFSLDSSEVNASMNTVPSSLSDYSLPVQIGDNGFDESSGAAFSFDSSEANISTSFEYWLGNNIINEDTEYSRYMEIESWLLEMDPVVYNSFDDLSFVSNIDQQEVSISDYDVSSSHMIVL